MASPTFLALVVSLERAQRGCHQDLHLSDVVPLCSSCRALRYLALARAGWRYRSCRCPTALQLFFRAHISSSMERMHDIVLLPISVARSPLAQAAHS